MLKKLKSIFIIEDKNDNQDEKNQQSTSKTKSTEPQDIKDENTDIPSDTVVNIDLDHPNELEGKPDPKFIDILLKAIEKNNLDGFDYLEYKQSLQSLNKMEMDEAIKYKSAFAMAKTMGATETKLMDSAKHYIGILNDEQKKFKEALINQRNKQIKGRESNLQKLEQSIQTKNQQIEKLKLEIEDTRNKLEAVRQEINVSAAKVESTNDKFHLAFNVVMQQIQEDLQKMKNYLK
jgi:hypothetical protein